MTSTELNTKVGQLRTFENGAPIGPGLGQMDVISGTDEFGIV